jgi:hypothetical protein
MDQSPMAEPHGSAKTDGWRRILARQPNRKSMMKKLPTPNAKGLRHDSIADVG